MLPTRSNIGLIDLPRSHHSLSGATGDGIVLKPLASTGARRRRRQHCATFFEIWEQENLRPGRKSSAETVVPLRPTGTRPRLSAPPSLSKAGRLLFAEIVASVDAKHFTVADTPLLMTLVSNTLGLRSQAKKLERDATPDVMKVWEKLVRLQLSLCTKLRLSVQSRVNPWTAGRRMADHREPSPLEQYLEEEDDNDDR